MIIDQQEGVPCFEIKEFEERKRDYALLIPIINEGSRIHKELLRAKESKISKYADIVICDGGSNDGCTNENELKNEEVNALLVKRSSGKQSTQLRMGIWWAIDRGYKGIITIDGNNKDSIEDVPNFIDKLKEGYDFVQGSRFIKGGKAIRTPFVRLIAVRFIHAPIISFAAKYHFTDSTNGFRAYSRNYLTDNRVLPLRDCFVSYELLAYLSVRASQIGMKVCEIPVTREYPTNGVIPTKISGIKGNIELLRILSLTLFGKYNP